MNYQQGPYGVPPPQQGHYGAPPQQGYYGAPYQQPVMMISAKSPGTAVLLEFLPGLFFQTFGIGNIYAGNVGAGIALMLGYWLVSAINFALCFVLIGFVTWPLCFIGAMILSAMLASSSANRANEAAMQGRVY